jgi:RNA polymerase sigma-70 factor, ECF subfamily
VLEWQLRAAAVYRAVGGELLEASAGSNSTNREPRLTGSILGQVSGQDAATAAWIEGDQRREVWAFCYQMLGSPFEAEDAAQDVFERVWRSRDRFDPARGTPAAWALRIARNVCIDRLRSAARRTLPRDVQQPGIDIGAPLVPRFDVPWLQPAPTGWCGGDEVGDAALRKVELRIAVTALLQSLPAPQRAVFVLRDVLGYSAAETAQAFELSVAAVNSSLQRARAALRAAQVATADESIHRAPTEGPNAGPAPRAELDRARVEEYARALESGDAAALERLVTDDVLLEMPPVPAWSRGRTAYRGFMDHLFAWRGTNWHVRCTSANHQPALLAYLVTDDAPTPHSLQLLATDGDGRVSHVLVYHDPALFTLFEQALNERSR